MPKQIKPQNIRNKRNKSNTREIQMTLPDIEIGSLLPPPITIEYLCSLNNFSPHDNKPGQTPNAFIIYKMALHNVLKELNKSYSLEKFSKLASKKWKNESEHVKLAYKRLAADVKSERKKMHPFVFLQDKVKENYEIVDSGQLIDVNQVTDGNKVEVDHVEIEVTKVSQVDNAIQVVGGVEANQMTNVVQMTNINDSQMINTQVADACQTRGNHIIKELYTPKSDDTPVDYFSDSDGLSMPSYIYPFNETNNYLYNSYCIYGFGNNTLYYIPSNSPECRICCYPLPDKNSYIP
ncbi:23797_t:CDS:1 [Dentiscutata erythropus]|uniref:23797_t:CDS:1 n=1 Tax=Dentiscutata erythropus TaxID=1348616 RepID=A0A9N9E7X4_9GLOM|nr:23797_t:CDS:1 [Dentiscutata erythropus]